MSVRATIRIVNRTHYRTDHLRAFVVHARAVVFGEDRKPLRVTFKPARYHCTGEAWVGGTQSTIRVPPPAHLDREKLAQVIKHELAHNAGAAGERWMRSSRAYGWAQGWRDTVAWAGALPLDPKPAGKAPSRVTVLEARLESIERRTAAWQSKAKRAASALRKLSRSRAYYQRRLAAMRGEK